MEFENDIFISYTHADNKPFDEHDEGWVDEFHRCLELRINVLSKGGSKINIWRDKRRLQGNDYFNDEIVQQLPKSAVLISIFSPGYLSSEWCIKELQEFCRKSGEIRLGNKSRIFKVIKLPVERSEYPAEVQKILDYRFHTETPPDPVIELTPTFHEYKKDYIKAITTLATNISEVLRDLKAENFNDSSEIHIEDDDSISNKSTQIKNVVYLAKTTSDLRDFRDKIYQELQSRGYMVLPGRELPDCNPEFEQAVEENLQQAGLSIHLMGKWYGSIPEASNSSIVELQYKLAKNNSSINSDFSYLLWFPENLQPEEGKQAELIADIQDDPECIQTGFEELKNIILNRLKEPKSNSYPISPKFGEQLLIYLIHDEQDTVEDIKPLYRYLMNLSRSEVLQIKNTIAEVTQTDQGKLFEVLRPKFKGDEVDIRKSHESKLMECDIFILFYGKGDEDWLRTKLNDLKKAVGLGRDKKIMAKAIYIAEPRTPDKELFVTNQDIIEIPDFDEFSPELLSDLLQEIARNL